MSSCNNPYFGKYGIDLNLKESANSDSGFDLSDLLREKLQSFKDSQNRINEKIKKSISFGLTFEKNGTSVKIMTPPSVILAEIQVCNSGTGDFLNDVNAPVKSELLRVYALKK